MHALGFQLFSATPLLALSVLIGFGDPGHAAPEKPMVTEAPKVVDFARDQTAVCEGLPGCDFVLLHGDPDTGHSHWFYRLKAGTVYPRHWHPTPENAVVITGALTFNFETGQRHTLTPGQYLRFEAGMIHWGQCEPGEDCLYYIYDDEPYAFILAE